MKETLVQFLGWKDPLEKGQLPTPVFWPGEFHGLYSPWGRKESDTTERLSLSQWGSRDMVMYTIRRIHWSTFLKKSMAGLTQNSVICSFIKIYM